MRLCLTIQLPSLFSNAAHTHTHTHWHSLLRITKQKRHNTNQQTDRHTYMTPHHTTTYLLQCCVAILCPRLQAATVSCSVSSWVPCWRCGSVAWSLRRSLSCCVCECVCVCVSCVRLCVCHSCMHSRSLSLSHQQRRNKSKMHPCLYVAHANTPTVSLT